MKYKHNLYTLLILFCAMLVAQNVVAQVTGDKYFANYNEELIDKSRYSCIESSGDDEDNPKEYAVDGNTKRIGSQRRMKINHILLLNLMMKLMLKILAVSRFMSHKKIVVERNLLLLQVDRLDQVGQK